MLFRDLIASLFFTGCGGVDRAYTNFTGEFTYKCSKSGVEYVQSDSGISIHLDRAGIPVPCD